MTSNNMKKVLNAVNLVLFICILSFLPLKREGGVGVELDMSYTPSKIPAASKVVTLKEKGAWCKSNYSCRKLAEAAYFEARGEDEMGVAIVLHTIKSRVEAPLWPRTYAEVIYQPKQFSYTHDGSLSRGMSEAEQVKRTRVMAYEVIKGELESPLGVVTHYHNLTVRPKWSKKINYLATVGNHRFYKGF